MKKALLLLSLFLSCYAWTQTAPTPVPGGTPDYFGVYPNYANSPLPTVTNGVVSGGLRKFVDSLPGLGPANASTLGASYYIPVALKDQSAYPGSDYYQIGLFDYTWRFHRDLPKSSKVRGYRDLAAGADGNNHYLGPVIIAKTGVPVRLKFTNNLSPSSKFFLPVDMTYMGAGMGPGGAMYSNNRAVIHLHGGVTPWISDGTPQQWITPVGDPSPYKKGVAFQNVPDMVGPGKSVVSPADTDATATYYYSNQQSGRLMFYHDHTYGLTRLNVYGGEAAGYLLWDDYEEDLISGTNVTGINPSLKKVIPDLGGVYHYGIPLIIQDKTFVPDNTTPYTNTLGTFKSALFQQDPTWDAVNWGAPGDLWFPHVYMPNQNPTSPDNTNPMGRWDWGPWFWPPMDPKTLMGTNPQAGLVSNPYFVSQSATPEEPEQTLSMPQPSGTPESFMDTPIVNGAAYPYLQVKPQAYRFRILNAANDRSLNLQLYYADPKNPTEVKMVPAVPNASFPPNWPTDGRDGGVPDPTLAGPPMIQIGNEGGLLSAPAVIPALPIGYEYNRRSVTVLNVSTHALLLGPAERADIIVDFSAVPSGSTLILYNDSPAPIPGFDPRLDYYTGNGDQTDTGGAPETLPGYGPNTRTIMQFRVSGTAGTSVNVADLNALLPAAFAASQPPPIVPEPVYSSGFKTSVPETYSAIRDTTLNFTPLTPLAYTPLPGAPALTKADGSSLSTPNVATPADGPVQVPMQSKTIQELFEMDYGRMNATLGVELPFTNFVNQTTIPMGYVDPTTEIMNNGDSQIWKITHNGVDTHFVHFHLFNVQVINRVGWDGTVKPPDPNELGWKETVRMNPLEDIIVAMKPVLPTVPFAVPLSRKYVSGDGVGFVDPTMPEGSTDLNSATIGVGLVDPATGNALTTWVPNANLIANPPNFNPVTGAPQNTYPLGVVAYADNGSGQLSGVVGQMPDFGWEYVWHCHILGHEENDMMRAIVVKPSSTPGAAVSPADITNPWPGSTLPATSATFSWSGGVGATAYRLLVGTARGGSDVYSSGATPNLTKTSQSVALNSVAPGSAIYVRLVTQFSGGSTLFNDYVYSAAKTVPTAVLASSLNPATSGQNVTFTATVNPLPTTGTVQFQDGGVVLGTCDFATVLPGCGALGTAAFTTSSLLPGPHSIVAVFSGNATFAGVESNTLSQMINAATPDFGLTVAPSNGSAIVKVGGSSNLTLTMTPINGFNSTVTFSCNTFKPGITCAINPQVLSPTASQAMTATLNVSVASTTASVLPNSKRGGGALWASFGGVSIFGCVLVGIGGGSRRRRFMIVIGLALAMTVALVGCGGKGTSAATPTPTPSPLVGPQQVAVTATGGGVTIATHQMTVNFTVQQ